LVNRRGTIFTRMASTAFRLSEISVSPKLAEELVGEIHLPEEFCYSFCYGDIEVSFDLILHLTL